MGYWGTCPLQFANACKLCRPNARWLSLLDDFVTTNFGTHAPRARAPLSKLLATPLPKNVQEALLLQRKHVRLIAFENVCKR